MAAMPRHHIETETEEKQVLAFHGQHAYRKQAAEYLVITVKLRDYLYLITLPRICLAVPVLVLARAAAKLAVLSSSVLQDDASTLKAMLCFF